MSKLFNASSKTIQEDLMVNGLVEGIQAGDVDAVEKFGAYFNNKLSRKLAWTVGNSYTSKEDMKQDLLLKAWELTAIWSKESNGNFLAFYHKSLVNEQIDQHRKMNREKRKESFEVNGEVTQRRISLDKVVGKNDDATVEDMLDSGVSTEEMVVDRLNERYVGMVVNDFVATTKGRNGLVVEAVYKGYKKGWDDVRVNEEIGKIIQAENGVEPKPEAIRKAKSRAMKKLREDLLDGKIEMVNQLEWDF